MKRELIENLSAACHTLLGNMIEASAEGPEVDHNCDDSVYEDFPRDETGKLWYRDVLDMKQAVEALDTELAANPKGKHEVHFAWGLDDPPDVTHHEYETAEELNAFLEGVDAASGWLDYEQCDTEDELNLYLAARLEKSDVDAGCCDKCGRSDVEIAVIDEQGDSVCVDCVEE